MRAGYRGHVIAAAEIDLRILSHRYVALHVDGINSSTALKNQMAADRSIRERQAVIAAAEVDTHVAVNCLTCQIDRDKVAGAAQVDANTARNAVHGPNQHPTFGHLVAIGVSSRNRDYRRRIAGN